MPCLRLKKRSSQRVCANNNDSYTTVSSSPFTHELTVHDALKRYNFDKGLTLLHSINAFVTIKIRKEIGYVYQHIKSN